MKIKPKNDYKLLGTSIQLDPNKVYDAEHATNQPDWEKHKKIFVLDVDDYGGSFMLGDGDYQIIED
jgi:hypothetical protein